MSLINATLEFSKHKLDDSEFVGTVEDNKDPLKLSRLKVRVIEVFGTQISTKDLPWAMPLRSTSFGAASNLSGFNVPVEGTLLIVKFHRGSVYTPMYSASPLTKLTTSSDFDTNYPNRYGFVDINGSKLIVDTVDKTLKYSHVSGSLFDIFTDGAVKAEHFTGTKIEIDAFGKIIVTGVKSATYNIVDDFIVNAKNITFNANLDVTMNAGNNVEASAGNNINFSAGNLATMFATTEAKLQSPTKASITGGAVGLGGTGMTGAFAGGGVSFTV